jgi:hypothetical protein
MLALVGVALVFWRHAKPPENPLSPELSSERIQDLQKPVTPSQRDPQQPPAVSRSTSPPMNRPSAEQDIQAYIRRVAEDPQYDWKQPINFFGKILDEKEQPVSFANAHLEWNSLNVSNDVVRAETNINTDAQGNFSLRGAVGKRLFIDVSKDGYYPQPGNPLAFEYAVPYEGLFTPDPSVPVVFHLRKKGEAEPLIRVKKDYRIPKNGTPVVINLANGAASSRSENIVVECWTSEPSGDTEGRYDWKCQVSVPGGGLTERTNELDFEAPADNYRSSEEIGMPSSLGSQWSNDVAKQYFAKLGDGRFARFRLRIIAGGDHFCKIESLLNPTGSRNLEFDPAKEISLPQ